MSKSMKLTLHIWRQANRHAKGKFEVYTPSDLTDDMSILEMLDCLNDQLIADGKDPVTFEHDCREGICGTCGIMINGMAHGPDRGTTTCQLYLRRFKDGDTLVLEPWRAKAFPVIKDLLVDRAAFDRIQMAGGYISVNVGNAPEANSILIPKEVSSEAFEAAVCIGCGACVAACKNASAMLFVSAKVGHMSMMPQGRPERHDRVLNMVAQMDEEGFGSCTNTLECSAACPKEISPKWIQRLHGEYIQAATVTRR